MEIIKYQKIIAKVLGTKQIAFNPDLAKALGSAKAGLFLSQLLFWWGKGNNPNWIYKTIKEMKKETALSRAEQDSAIKICKKFNLLKTTRKGIPAKRYFWLDVPKIVELLESTLLKDNEQDCKKATNFIAKNSRTNTNNNTKNTNKKICFSSNENKASLYKQGKRWGEKPYFRGEEMRWIIKEKKWKAIPRDGGDWLEFGGKESEIEWK
jgi:hypothetical protein